MYAGKSAEGIAGKIKYSFPLVTEIVEVVVYLFDSPTPPPAFHYLIFLLKFLHFITCSFL